MQVRNILAQHLGFFLLYWGAGFLAWLAFTGTFKRWELLIGAACAGFAAWGAELARSGGVAAFRPKPAWVFEGWRLPWYIVQGCAQILWVMFRNVFKHEQSVLRSVVFDGGGDDPKSAARRALAVTYTTMPPNFSLINPKSAILRPKASRSNAHWTASGMRYLQAPMQAAPSFSRPMLRMLKAI